MHESRYRDAGGAKRKEPSAGRRARSGFPKNSRRDGLFLVTPRLPKQGGGRPGQRLIASCCSERRCARAGSLPTTPFVERGRRLPFAWATSGRATVLYECPLREDASCDAAQPAGCRVEATPQALDRPLLRAVVACARSADGRAIAALARGAPPAEQVGTGCRAACRAPNDQRRSARRQPVACVRRLPGSKGVRGMQAFPGESRSVASHDLSSRAGTRGMAASPKAGTPHTCDSGTSASSHPSAAEAVDPVRRRVQGVASSPCMLVPGAWLRPVASAQGGATSCSPETQSRQGTVPSGEPPRRAGCRQTLSI